MSRISNNKPPVTHTPARTGVTAPASPAHSAGTATPAKPAASFEAVKHHPRPHPAPAPVPVPGNVVGNQTPQNLVMMDLVRGFVPVSQPNANDLKGAVVVDFQQGKGQPPAQIKAGGKFLLTYDPARTPVTGSAGGFPAYGVTAYVQLQPSGKIIEQPAIGFEQTPSRVLGRPYAAPVLIDVPAGTTSVSVWFRQYSGGDRPPAQQWDSNYGQNYNFPVT